MQNKAIQGHMTVWRAVVWGQKSSKMTPEIQKLAPQIPSFQQGFGVDCGQVPTAAPVRHHPQPLEKRFEQTLARLPKSIPCKWVSSVQDWGCIFGLWCWKVTPRAFKCQRNKTHFFQANGAVGPCPLPARFATAATKAKGGGVCVQRAEPGHLVSKISLSGRT